MKISNRQRKSEPKKGQSRDNFFPRVFFLPADKFQDDDRFVVATSDALNLFQNKHAFVFTVMLGDIPQSDGLPGEQELLGMIQERAQKNTTMINTMWKTAKDKRRDIVIHLDDEGTPLHYQLLLEVLSSEPSVGKFALALYAQLLTQFRVFLKGRQRVVFPDKKEFSLVTVIQDVKNMFKHRP